MICLSLTGRTLEEDRVLLESCRNRIALAELRADLLDPDQWPGISRFCRTAGLPLILSVRRTEDGGAFRGTPEKRMELLAGAPEGGFAYAELEEDLPVQPWEEGYRGSGGTVIRSFFDPEGVPEALTARTASLARHPGEIARVEVTPGDTAGLIRLLEACGAPGSGRRILLGRGPVGVPTRILARRLGSLMTFADPPGTGDSGGHTVPDSLEEIYRYSQMGEGTGLYGIIGNPVLHTRSPLIQNRGFRQLGLDCVYVPFQVEDPVPFLRWAAGFGFRGFSVTVPHKQAVIPLLEEAGPEVGAIGSCNTLVRTPRGGWSGHNTDAPGFSLPLERIWGADGFRGRSALVLGAGGAARAVVWELLRRGLTVTIANRNAGRAEALAGELGALWEPLGDGSGLRAGDLVVQTTSAGMHPLEGVDPAPELPLTGREVVYDIVYAPPETAFLKKAERAGCRIIRGMEMLSAQGHDQFRLFTGLDYPEFP